MALRFARAALFVTLLVTPAWAAAGQDALAAVYADVLRGNWEAGRTRVDQLAAQGDEPGASRLRDWLTAYHDVVASRKDLKARSFEWNLEQARAALGDDKLYLALTFALQASAYAADPNEFAATPWVTELIAQAKAAALAREEQGQWAAALSYYAALGRIRPHDDELKELSEHAARRARLEVTYKDEESLREHIRDVDKSLFRATVKRISQLYYQEPDFTASAGCRGRPRRAA